MLLVARRLGGEQGAGGDLVEVARHVGDDPAWPRGDPTAQRRDTRDTVDAARAGPAPRQTGVEDGADRVDVGALRVVARLDAVQHLLDAEAADPDVAGVGEHHELGAQVAVGDADGPAASRVRPTSRARAAASRGAIGSPPCERELLGVRRAGQPLGDDDEAAALLVGDGVEDVDGAPVGDVRGAQRSLAQRVGLGVVERQEADADGALEPLVLAAPERGAGGVAELVDEAVAPEHDEVRRRRARRARRASSPGHGARLGRRSRRWREDARAG